MQQTYDLAPQEFGVTLKDAKGSEKEYVVREPSEDAVRRWKNATNACIRASGDGRIMQIVDPADCDTLLVALCLHEVRPDGSTGKVAKGFVEGLPRRVSKDLYQRIRVEFGWALSEDGGPLRDGLLEVLGRADSKLPLEEFRSWVKELHEADPGSLPLRALWFTVKDDESEQHLKNGSSGTRLTSPSAAS